MNFLDLYKLTREDLLKLPIRENAEPADKSPSVVDDDGITWVFGDDGMDLLRTRDDDAGPYGTVKVEPTAADA